VKSCRPAQFGGKVCQLPQQVIDLTPIDCARRVPFDHGRPAPRQFGARQLGS